MTVYNNLGGEAAVDAGITEAEALLEAKKVSGYLGLLSPYYFGGAGTTTNIEPGNVNQWVDVNLTVDPAGTFDYRPQDMVDADATGFSGAGGGGSALSYVTFTGNLDKNASSGTAYVVSTSGGDVTITKSSTSNFWNVRTLVGLSYSVPFDFTTGVPTANQVKEYGGITYDLSAVRWLAGATTIAATDNATPADPYLFHLSGLTQQSFGKLRVTALFNPDIDEGQLDVRLLFTPNSAGTFGQFDIAEQAATMTQGAGIDYFVEPTTTFFVGNTIEDLGSDFGKFQFQIRSSVEGTFTLRGLTMYIHS